jgi:hypothetical protein
MPNTGELKFRILIIDDEPAAVRRCAGRPEHADRD